MQRIALIHLPLLPGVLLHWAPLKAALLAWLQAFPLLVAAVEPCQSMHYCYCCVLSLTVWYPTCLLDRGVYCLLLLYLLYRNDASCRRRACLQLVMF